MDARAELAQAKTVFDATQSVHFHLASADVHGTGIQLTGGDGHALRPNQFTGTLSVNLNGFPADISIVSTGGVFYAKLPFGSTYTVAKPADYGFGDPATMLDPARGLPSLISAAKSPAALPNDRLAGEELLEVQAMLPGSLVGHLLTSANQSQDVRAVVGISAGTHQVRRIVLTGPFFVPTQNSTYTLLLDKYGETVAVTPPA